MNIPICRPTLPKLESYTKELSNIWESHILSNFGVYATKFQELTKNYIGAKDLVVIVSGDMGLVGSLAALNLPEGSEVIMPSFTFNSTVNSVIWNRLKPVFADIDEKTFCIDPKDVEKKITKKTKVVIGTHIFGNACDADKLNKICKKNKLTLLFDAAHGYGSSYKGKKVGSLGDIEVFSLSGTKVATSAEGGLISFKDPKLAEKFRMFRNYGFISDYNSQMIGVNGKMSELHAALGILTLSQIDKYVKVRNKLAQRYMKALNGVGDIRFQVVPEYNVSTYKDFAILTKERDGLYEYLSSKGIQTKKYFFPIHYMDCFKGKKVSLPVTEKVFSQILCIPIYNEISKDEFNYVVNAIKEYFKNK